MRRVSGTVVPAPRVGFVEMDSIETVSRKDGLSTMMKRKKHTQIDHAVRTVLETLERRRLLSGSMAFELNPLTVPGIVTDDTTGEQQQTDVDYNGGVGVTVWSDDAAGNSDDVMARLFDSSG